MTMRRHLPLAAVAVAATLAAAAAHAQSYYPVRLDDPKAVYLDAFGAKGDGVADDADAIQRAIDKVQETVVQGIVFVPPGRYRLSKTIHVWPSIRLMGYGPQRPVFLLAPNSPGYHDPNAEQYLVFFAGSRPAAWKDAGARPAGHPPDANPGTFYSAMSNIDVEIGDGNPGAVAVRGTYAQHGFLAHMDLRIGSGLAGVHDTGNVMEDVHFQGGRYGIWTRTPSPGWQFVAVDVSFEDQREAAIRETAAGLTLVRPRFRRVPTAISIDEGSYDELWVKDARMEEVSGPAVVIGLERNARTEINMENVACRRVPTFAQFRESGRKLAGPGETYVVKSFAHGLHFDAVGGPGAIKTRVDAAAVKALPEPVPSDLVPLPPADTWVNVRSLGAKGDGATDDTAVIRKAIAEHRAVYFPSGYYVVSDTLALRADTVLIGLHPLATQIDLLDGTAAFQGAGDPKPMIEAPKGGTNVVIGLGLYTNGINPRAVAAKWMAGAASMMNDVRFLGGHGTNNLDGSRANPYNNTHTADPDLNRRWDGQYPSLWVTDGGGGTFFDLWTPSTFAQAGMLVSDTTTAGRVYAMSSEHHVRYEVQVRRAAHWSFYALQTEEERGEGPFALPLEIDSSSDITVANFHIYRVTSSYQPFPYAITVANSRDIRFRNVHCYSNSKVAFDATVRDLGSGGEVRAREFAWLDVPGTLSRVAQSALARAATVLAPGAKVHRLASGFFNISGGAVSSDGDFYFVDARWHRIYRWSTGTGRLAIVSDAPLDPVNLAFDKAGNLLVVSYAGNGTVFAMKTGVPGAPLQRLDPVAAAPRPGAVFVRPAGEWRVAKDTASGLPVAKPFHYVSPDGSTVIPAGRDFVTGVMSWGVKAADLLRTFGLARATPGQPFYLTSEAEVATWRGTVGPDGNFTTFEPFVQQGGESVAVDRGGNVYIAAGHVEVYNPAGRLLQTIETPERPMHLAFGGKDGRTLFIATRSALYSIGTGTEGRR